MSLPFGFGRLGVVDHKGTARVGTWFPDFTHPPLGPRVQVSTIMTS